MAEDQEYNEKNKAERERLVALVGRFSDQQLSRDLGYGWTGAVALAHLAFWDYVALQTLRDWKQGKVRPVIGDADIVNDSNLPLYLGLPPRVAANEAITAAELVDKEVAALDDAMAKALILAGKERAVRRHMHRQNHLDELEQKIR